MPVNYSPAREVQKFAQDVIRDHHAHLINNGVYVLFLFTDEQEKVKGKTVLGTARKISGLHAYLARMDEEYRGQPDFFLICVYSGWWRGKRVTDDQRRALVDHELMHLWSEEVLTTAGEPTGRIALSLRPHDLEEFNAIFARHGAWLDDIQDFLDAGEGQQLSFDELQDHMAKKKETTVTLTTRQGSVTLSGEKLRQQAERSRT